jgi:hypothetical protein
MSYNIPPQERKKEKRKSEAQAIGNQMERDASSSPCDTKMSLRMEKEGPLSIQIKGSWVFIIRPIPFLFRFLFAPSLPSVPCAKEQGEEEGGGKQTSTMHTYTH